ncbi:hypothetical protein ABFX02_03G011800 [Erythranthe guttata]
MEEDISSRKRIRRNPPSAAARPPAPPSDEEAAVKTMCAPTQMKTDNPTFKNSKKIIRKEVRRKRPLISSGGGAAGTTAVSIFKIPDLSYCCSSVMQPEISGCAVITKGILVVEGEVRYARRCLRVMLRRKGAKFDSVKVIWQGKVSKPSFGKFSILHCSSDVSVCKFFADHGASHYWDLAVKSV